ncbi:MAG: ester cyclase [Bacteroidota bacterium]
MLRLQYNIIIGITILIALACQPQESIEDKELFMDKKEIVKQKFFQSLWNEHEFDIAHEIFTDDFYTESMSFETSNWIEMHGKGSESMIHHVKWWLDIIPDAKMHITGIAANDNMVVVTWQLVGTMKGKLLDHLPNHKSLEISGCSQIYFKGDRIKMNRTLLDKYGLFEQIGAL